jgi:ring-1,2-phenylacetyl-CoA epoxidase subunit PaaE
MALRFQKLKVTEVVHETEDAISIHFANPDRNIFTYHPGQYLTIRVEINGKPYNRAYSLCSSPVCDEDLAVTVKRMPEGLVSSYLNDNLKPGTQLDVFPPLGNFVIKLNGENRKHYVFFGAGSGITPLYAMLRSVLFKESESKVTLVYGNRNEKSIIFRKGLEKLVQQYAGRLNVIHALTQPSDDWRGLTGRLNRGKVKEIVTPLLANDALAKEFYTCGPSAMMDEVMHGLRELQVPAENVHVEHFSAPLTHPMDEPVSDTTAKPAAHQVKVILEGEEKTISVSPNESILEAALDNDMDPPYACMIGSCCTCKAKLVEGKVIMDDREGLTDDEIREGFILTCQSHPTTEGVVVSYDEI